MSLRTVCSLPPFLCTSGAAKSGVQALVWTSADGEIALPNCKLGKCCEAPKSVRRGQPLRMSPFRGPFHSTLP
eukprot:4661867-Amphidinium_carterae.1